jgi:hypothetical protein
MPLSISPNILKEVALENAMLYDGMVDIFNDSGNRLMSLVDCFIYELQYAFMSHSGSLNISFFIELDYEYRLGTGPVQRGSRSSRSAEAATLVYPLGRQCCPPGITSCLWFLLPPMSLLCPMIEKVCI